MLQKKPKVIAIVGPTASGKSALAIEIAKLFNGEIISADSRQVYRGLDIGTAKISRDEMAGIPHHLIDIIDVNKVFTAHDFRHLANQAILDITERQKIPIVVGGTFFYLDQLRGSSGVADVPPNEKLRKDLASLSLSDLQHKLERLNPQTLNVVDTANPRRLIRAIEIITALGYLPSANTTNPYTWLTIALAVSKENLRLRYTARAEAWLDNGFLTEIATLLRQGVTEDQLTEIGFEYTLGLRLFEKQITEVEFVEQFVQKNWQYAKRQLTWLKRDKTALHCKPEETDKIITSIKSFLKD